MRRHILHYKVLFLQLNLIFSALSVTAQNYVNNGSFEDYGECQAPYVYMDVSGWYRVPQHAGSPDYFNACTNFWNASIPTSSWGTQIPEDGNAYIGLASYVYPGEIREYAETQLSMPLIAGELYYVSFFVSLVESSKYASNNIGVILTTDQVIGSNSFAHLDFIPQIYASEIVTNKEIWTEVSGIYQAIGGEQFLTFGNFHSDEQTLTILLAESGNDSSYYFIDNVSVSPLLSVSQFDVNVLKIFPNPFSEELYVNLENDIIRQVKIYSGAQLIKTLNGNFENLDLSSLSQGTYIAVITTNSGKLLAKKIVKK